MVDKIVAVMLLLAFMAVPGFAAMQCRPSAPSTHMHCSRCAMMMANSGETHIAAVNTTAPCCRVLPNAPVPKPVSATQPQSRLVMVPHDHVVGGAMLAMQRVQNPSAPDRSPHQRTQSVLCTFLI